MKIELSTTKGDFKIELPNEIDRLKFVQSLPRLITSQDFKYASMIEDEGTAKFDTIDGFIRVLKNYKED